MSDYETGGTPDQPYIPEAPQPVGGTITAYAESGPYTQPPSIIDGAPADSYPDPEQVQHQLEPARAVTPLGNAATNSVDRGETAGNNEPPHPTAAGSAEAADDEPRTDSGGSVPPRDGNGPTPPGGSDESDGSDEADSGEPERAPEIKLSDILNGPGHVVMGEPTGGKTHSLRELAERLAAASEPGGREPMTNIHNIIPLRTGEPGYTAGFAKKMGDADLAYLRGPGMPGPTSRQGEIPEEPHNSASDEAPGVPSPDAGAQTYDRLPTISNVEPADNSEVPDEGEQGSGTNDAGPQGPEYGPRPILSNYLPPRRPILSNYDDEPGSSRPTTSDGRPLEPDMPGPTPERGVAETDDGEVHRPPSSGEELRAAIKNEIADLYPDSPIPGLVRNQGATEIDLGKLPPEARQTVARVVLKHVVQAAERAGIPVRGFADDDAGNPVEYDLANLDDRTRGTEDNPEDSEAETAGE